MSKVLEKEIVNRDCPHCKEHVSIAWVCKLEADGIIRYIYFCPNCQKAMKISDKKGTIKATVQNSKAFQI
jgi:ribosomal protein S27AE